MAQILSFPQKTLSVDAGRDDAARSVARRQMEAATAEFDRMLAHHSDLQRQAAEFARLCEEATGERPSAEVLYYPVTEAADRLYA